MTKMLHFELLKRTLRSQRSKDRGNQQEPKEQGDIIVDEHILKIGDYSSFLLVEMTD